MDRKPNVASYICRDETIEDYNVPAVRINVHL